jgi:hypothetical protein
MVYGADSPLGFLIALIIPIINVNGVINTASSPIPVINFNISSILTPLIKLD